MKKITLIPLLLATLSGFAQQSKITVTSTANHTPIEGATISCNKHFLAKTDPQGIATFTTRCKNVDVKAPGFYEDEAVTDKVMELSLSNIDPKIKDIEEVKISENSDPKALAILTKVTNNYEKNSPQSLDSYSFRSYEKYAVDIDEDSVKSYQRFVNREASAPKENPKPGKMMTSRDLDNLMKNSKVFLWERAQEYLYTQKTGEKIKILDNRVAGLKNPVYEMLPLRSNRTNMPREIRKENRGLYRFFLTDSIDIDGRKNYVIRFREVDYKQPVQQRRYNGYLYIDADSYALKKLESNSKIKSEGTITSIWTPIDGKWFLQKENFKVKLPDGILDRLTTDKKTKEEKSRNKFREYITLNSDYSGFKTPAEAEDKDFGGYTMDVINADGKKLYKYRTDTLSKREYATYATLDSVGKKYHFDRRANLLANLTRGTVRIGQVDFDATRLLGYNQYEGLRVGVGAKLNEGFNKYISPDAYIAYGFKDRGLKYGAGVDFRTTLRKNSFFRAEYYNDVVAAGRFSENLWNFRMKLMNSGMDLKNDRFYRYNGFKLSYENDLTNALTVNVSAKRDHEAAKFGYSFRNLGDEFDNFSTKITLKYSPNSKNIMTPAGKYTYDQRYPEFYLDFEQGMKAFGGDLNYSRIEGLALHNFESRWGTTGVRLFGGLSSGNAPIWHNFTMTGLSGGNGTTNFNLSSYLGFATMEGARYYDDKFAGYYFTHRIPFYFKSFGKNTSSFDVIYRGVIGNMKNPDYHQFEFQKLDHLYQEVGLEWNNFLSSQFNLGVFYRVGYYKTDLFKENFAIQLKLKALGF